MNLQSGFHGNHGVRQRSWLKTIDEISLKMKKWTRYRVFGKQTRAVGGGHKIIREGRFLRAQNNILHGIITYLDGYGNLFACYSFNARGRLLVERWKSWRRDNRDDDEAGGGRWEFTRSLMTRRYVKFEVESD